MLLVTDLDNTLYDWVTFFAQSFRAMLAELSVMLTISEADLLREFQTVHQRYGNSEQPFAIFELPSVQRRFPDASRFELLGLLREPLYAFNPARKKHLRLYDGVEETLSALTASGVTVVGHTEAIAANAFYRLVKLDILKYFTRLYTLEGCYEGHPDPEREAEYTIPSGFVRQIPKAERKPNAALLRHICVSEGADVSTAWYVGDSLTRDMSMAKEAHVKAVWARYGTLYDRRYWSTLVSITHWTEADVKREEELRTMHRQVEPDYCIDNFSELKRLMLETFPGDYHRGETCR